MKKNLQKEKIKQAKLNVRRTKDSIKIKKLEEQLRKAEQRREKKEWKSNFVDYVNKYIMTPYRMAQILPTMGDDIFIAKDEFNVDNIIGCVGDKYFFTYLDGRSTVIAVFEEHVSEIHNDDETVKTDVPSYKVKTVKCGVIGTPVTKTAEFHIIDAAIYSDNVLVDNFEYNILTERKDRINEEKNRYIKYLSRK